MFIDLQNRALLLAYNNCINYFFYCYTVSQNILSAIIILVSLLSMTLKALTDCLLSSLLFLVSLLFLTTHNVSPQVNTECQLSSFMYQYSFSFFLVSLNRLSAFIILRQRVYIGREGGLYNSTSPDCLINKDI